MDDGQRQFHLKEFETLHEEIAESLKGCRDVMRYTLVSSAALFAWMATKAPECINEDLFRLICLIPAMMTLFGGAASYFWMRRVGETGAYLRKLETYLGSLDLGWQDFLSQQRTTLKNVGLWFWLLLLAGNIAVGTKISPKACAAGQATAASQHAKAAHAGPAR